MLHSIRRLLATRNDRIITVTVAFLLVGLGYVAGLWTAEVQKEVPIVFESPQEESGILTQEDIQKLYELYGKAGAAASSGIVQESSTVGQGTFVASVNGGKYYFTHCSEVNRIKEENLIWFSSEKEALEAGYEMSACIQRERGLR